MRVYVSIKQAGKKRPVLEKQEYSFDPGIDTLRGVLRFFTEAEVSKYNSGGDGSHLLYFDENRLEDMASEGKLSFGVRPDRKKVDPEDAVEKTILSFSDGLVRVFLGDSELTELDKPLEIKEGDVFTFIRFTFLAGRMW